jgi:hypothetical protein
MSSINCLSLSPTYEHPSKVAFMDQRLKTLRVVADLTSDVIIGLFCKIISACLWLACCPGASYRYSSLAHYYINRGCDHATAYATYSDKIVNFAYNTPRHVKEILLEEVSEKKALYQMYGKKRIQKWLKIGNEIISVKKKYLSRCDMIEGGCCTGMSFEFNAKYLQGIEKGLEPLEAVKYASYRYAKGATKKAELIQIFGKALHIKKRKDLPEKERIAWETQRVVARWCILADKVGLKMQKITNYPHTDMNKKTKQLERFVKQLPDGAYTVLLTPDKGVGHAISVVKADDECFLFNPNDATCAFDIKEIAKELQSIGKEATQSPKCHIAFISFELNPE